MVSVDGQPHVVPVPRVRTLLDLVRETVASSPDRLAIDADDGQLTHAELFDAARALAGRLRRLRIGPGDRVGVHVPSDAVDLYVAILGVLHAGAAYVPVDAGDPPAYAAAIWEQAGAVAVVEPGLALRELRPPAGADRSVTADDEAWVTFAPGPSPTPAAVGRHPWGGGGVRRGGRRRRPGDRARPRARRRAGPAWRELRGDVDRVAGRRGARPGSPLTRPRAGANGAGGSPSDASTSCWRVRVPRCRALLQSDTLPKTSRRRR